MLNVLVSAGPTREHLDEVRFFTNASSGRMGYALASAAARRGHRVTLVAGPTALRDPARVRVVHVVSAVDMQRALTRAFPRCDVLFMVAAVADWRPATRLPGKVPKSGRPLSVRLVPNPDIVTGLAARKGARVVVGFAMEVQDALARARAKLVRKRLDLLVLTDASVAGGGRTTAIVLAPGGETFRVAGVTKAALAGRLVTAAARLHARRAVAAGPLRAGRASGAA